MATRFIHQTTFNDREFRIQFWKEYRAGIRGVVQPVKAHPFEQEPLSHGQLPLFEVPITTELRFKIANRGTQHERAIVQAVSVIPSERRKRWASDMVAALFYAFPENTSRWDVESPNERSQALFVNLHERFPTKVAEPEPLVLVS